jgi:hypothetical protein
MDQIVVDVVLLPQREMMDRTIEANRQLVEAYGPIITLDTNACLPHISLAMGCMERRQVEPVRHVLETLVRDCPLGELVVTGIVTTMNAQGQHISSFVLAKTAEIQNLHEQVTQRMEPYFTYDVTAETICGNEPVEESTLAWIRTFREKSSFAAFFPHITIGYGMVTEPMTFPMRIRTPWLALGRLGNHCTCRKVLTHVEIRNPNSGIRDRFQ